MVYLQFIQAGLLTILVTLVFYVIGQKESFKKISYLRQQFIIGICFGLVACLATQFGIKCNGYVMNVRQAAPLTAGLLFGAPAGLLAGCIGALYRWFSVYWGIGSYTRVACSLGTLMAGCVGALSRKQMFHDRKSSWFYGFIIGITVETIHMVLIFMTHMSDIDTAFTVVRVCAGPMILANSVTTMISIFLVTTLGKDNFAKEVGRKPITRTFSISLLVCVMIAFCITITFTFRLQDGVSDTTVRSLLKLNIEDVVNEVDAASDSNMLEITKDITEDVDKSDNFEDITIYNREEKRKELQAIADYYEVDEINVVNAQGTITISTNPNFDNFAMNSVKNGQAIKFLCLLDEKTEYVAPLSAVDYDHTLTRKYAGVRCSHGGFIQVGYDEQDFKQILNKVAKYTAMYRHIEKTGFMFLIDQSTHELISAPDDAFTDISIDDFNEILDDNDENHVLTLTSDSGVEYYLMYRIVEGYYVGATITVSEALFARDISVYIGLFMQIIVFFSLFILIYYLIGKIIIGNIYKINESLARIAKGDLSITVDVRSNDEFSSLSDDINKTVSTLKQYISDAEKRIDQELELAKIIQSSSLPSVFPPFPHRTEFDIFASMIPAKEVGGDFYDFFFVGDKKLFFLIADVSGKGIPAAMFMMTSKVMIKSLAETGLAVNDVLTQANEKLCEINDAEMFVTVWLGMIDLSDGTLTYASAGHNPPLIGHTNGTFTFLKGRKSLVLAGMQGIRYPINEYQMHPGDCIYLYTDGVTEATNADNQLYGDARLLQYFNTHEIFDVTQTCKGVLSDVDQFVAEAEQFDDITMLMFKLKETRNATEYTFIPTSENLTELLRFVDKWMDRTIVKQIAIDQVHSVLTEVYTTLIEKSEATYVRVFYLKYADYIYLSFEDNGKEYDIDTLNIDKTIKIVEDISYTYHDNNNVLTLQIRETGL